MILEKEFKSGDLYYYSDFYDKSFCEIKAIKIYKKARNRPTFWFNAEVTNNDHIDNKVFHEVGSVHSFSNSFVYKSLADLKQGVKDYKIKQIGFITQMANMELARIRR
jgi:hypothetical protein